MITEKALQEAIRECEAEPITSSKISKLADLYTVYDHLFGEKYPADYGYSATNENVITTYGDSELQQIVNGKKAERIWAVIDELANTVKVMYPKIYNSFIDKLNDL